MPKFDKNSDNYKKNNKKVGTFQKKKSTYVKKKLPIAYSDFYADTIDSLYNILSEISWDKISIPVKMIKIEKIKDRTKKETVVVGNVTKFNNDNTFTISMTAENAKTVTDDYVVGIKCYKDKATGEVSYITDLIITNRFKSISNYYADIEAAFKEADEKSSVDVADDTTEVSE